MYGEHVIRLRDRLALDAVINEQTAIAGDDGVVMTYAPTGIFWKSDGMRNGDLIELEDKRRFRLDTTVSKDDMVEQFVLVAVS